YLRGTKGLISIVANPSNVKSFFELADGLRSVGGFEARCLRYMRSIPENAALMDERYSPPPPDLAALARLPEGSLGKRLADHLAQRNLDADFYPKKTVRDEASYTSMRMRSTHDIW